MSLSSPVMKKLSHKKSTTTTAKTTNEVVVVEPSTKPNLRFLMRSFLFLALLALYYWLFVLDDTIIQQTVPHKNNVDSSLASISSVHDFNFNNVKHNNNNASPSSNTNNNHNQNNSTISAIHVQGAASEEPDDKSPVLLDQGVTVQTTTIIGHGDDDTKDDEIDSIDIAAWPKQQQPQPANDQLNLKIAIFMTTSMSAQHLDFLEQCWPAAVEHLPLVKKADLLVYTSNRNYTTTYFRNLGFQNQIVMYYYDELYPTIPKNEAKFSERKQDGAVRAMVDPFKPENQWFQHYDWVVRLNPDVLIRSDTWLLNAMKNASNEGIFGDWLNPKRKEHFLFTDFYAFRPRAVNQVGLIKGYELQKKYHKLHAEAHILYGFKELVKKSTIAWIPNIKLYKPNLARTIGPDCDIIHYHPFIKHCPNYFDAHDTEEGYYRQRYLAEETAALE